MEDSHEQRPDAQLQTPKAAAVAGIVFSVLLAIALILLGLARPDNASSWLPTPIWTLALSLIPFTGIAFLWFVGVVRDRIGVHEDRFFSTVFLGSGLIFVVLLFVSAAIAGSFTLVAHTMSHELIAFGQQITFMLMDIYTMKMAAVFMISASTIFLRTGILSRWFSYLGYLCAILLLIIDRLWEWALLLFPLWVFLLSVEILLRNFHTKSVEGPEADR